MEGTCTFEGAPSGRARCRGCSRPIEKGSLRLGEHLPNPFRDRGTMTLWFHPQCGAYVRPEAFLTALESSADRPDDADALGEAARFGLEHRRLPRLRNAQRSPTGRAKCRSCRETIPKDSWRIALVYYEDGRFDPSGFIHTGCARNYFDTAEIIERLEHFTPEMTGEEKAEVLLALQPTSP